MEAQPRVRPLELLLGSSSIAAVVTAVSGIIGIILLDELLQVVVASPEAANLCLAFCSEALKMLLVPPIQRSPESCERREHERGHGGYGERRQQMEKLQPPAAVAPPPCCGPQAVHQRHRLKAHGSGGDPAADGGGGGVAPLHAGPDGGLLLGDAAQPPLHLR